MRVHRAGRPYISPLRYPGGKARLGDFLTLLLAAQPRRATHYVEVFAGGAGAALHLLVGEHVDLITLNDLDRGVAAFWRSAFFHPAELMQRVRTTRVSVTEWRRQREIYLQPQCEDDVALGFATLFLNRTNRSGILGARPIGGMKQQGRWKVDVRYNKESLLQRLALLRRYATRVTVQERDGVGLVKDWVRDDRTFMYIDPPYLGQGKDLYLDTLAWRDHQDLACRLGKRRGWFLTYDADPRVRTELYPTLRCATFNIAHTAQRQHVGREYAVFADGLIVPSLSALGRYGGRYLPARQH